MRIADGERCFTTAFELGTAAVSVQPYSDPAYFEQEKDRLFRRAWLSVAHVNDVPNPGDYILRRIEVCNAQAIIVRGKDGVVRAFHDVCSHRGSPITPPGQTRGNVRTFRCRYHSWTYDTAGQLVHVPDEEKFFGLDKTQLGLTPIHCDVWDGFIFLNFEAQPSVTLQQYLGPFVKHLEGLQVKPGYPLNPDTDYVRAEAIFHCNWKSAIGAFNESYHIRTLHPNTIAQTFTSDENPFGHPVSVVSSGIHRVIGLFGNSQYRPDPERNRVEMKAFPQGFYKPRSRQEMQQLGLDHPAFNPTDDINWSQDIHTFFPNFFFQVRSSGLFTVRWWPLAHNRTRWEGTLYFPRAKNVRQRFAQEYSVARWRDIIIEDILNLEDQQVALESGAKSTLWFNDSEVMLRHQHETVQRFIDADDISKLV